jgi:plasmid replication initiation protein
MTYDAQNNKLDQIIAQLELLISLVKQTTPKNTKDLLTEYFNEISTHSAYNNLSLDPNFTNNDVGLPGGIDSSVVLNCNDKLCTCNK